MTNNSIRRHIITSIVITCAVLVLCYSILLRLYLKHGLNLDTEYRLTSEASLYFAQFETNPNTPLPKTATTTAYLDYEGLPESIRALVSQDKLVDGDFLRLDSPEVLYYIYSAPRADGHQVHFVFHFQKDSVSAEIRQYFDMYFLYIPVGLGITTTVLVIILSIYMLDRIARPVVDLKNWATRLNMENMENEPPDFTYAEFHDLADLFQNNLRRLNAGVEREKKFQQYASHELRTPIAIIKNNLELMERLGIHEYEQFKSSFSRMDKAVMKMQHLTNTLLWACREEDVKLDQETFALDELLSKIASVDAYLLEGKQVGVDCKLAPISIHAPKPVVTIILSNIVRNAFQHCTSGTIRITCDSHALTIANEKPSVQRAGHQDNFGLGLQIVRQLSKRIGWECEIIDQAGMFTVTLDFSLSRAST